MSLIVGQGLCKSWSDKDVLRNVTFTLAPDDRVGLVGPNGQGKTTLLRMIAGIEEPTEGLLQRKNGLRIGYLPQDPPALEGSSLRQAMLDVFGDLHQIEQELHDLAHQMSDEAAPGGPDAQANHDKLLARYGDLQHQFESRGGYTYSNKIDQVLTGLNFSKDLWNHPLSHLSGGQRTRAFLARLLLEGPEVLLLDEPTNHLDLEAVEWLEKWLQDFAGSLIVVSHDRYFLDRATSSTWEVAFAAVECYKGSYSHYLTQRDERYKERMRRYDAQQEFIEETQEFIRRFIAGQRSKEAQGRRTRLERFMKTEAIEKPREHPRINVRFRVVQRTGDFVLHLNELQAGYQAGKPLATVEKLDVQRGQRIAIVGPNGCGKTTLLRTILGKLPSLGGTARWGANVRIGYLSQTHVELNPDGTALDSVREFDPAMTEEHGRNLLGSLLLSGDDAFKRISELSGGQRSRIVLARLILQKPNVLFLDEPTNHLDINSQEVLQDVLSDFDGTVMFVSHDRYLIQALATHIWALHEGEITVLGGNWDKFLEWRERQAGLDDSPQERAQAAEKARAQRKGDFQDRRRKTNEFQRLQRRFAEVEQTIHKLEDNLKKINEGIHDASQAGDVERITRLGEEYTATNDQLQELVEEWGQLGEQLETPGPDETV